MRVKLAVPRLFKAMARRLVTLLGRGLLVGMALMTVDSAAWAAELGSAPARPWREEVLHIPAEPGGPLLVVTLVRPDGPGPFPLAVMNHGASAGVRETATRYRDTFATYYFLSRGYAVALPMMRGFAGSEGRLVGDGCDVKVLATNGARDIVAVIGELAKRSDLDGSRIVVAGQSFGGWNTLAVGMLRPPGVRALVNFNGGVSIAMCRHMRDDLVAGAKGFGAQTTVPSLWFYGETDSLFPPATWRSMFAAYTARGAPAEIVDVGGAFTDSHQFLVDPSAAAKWMPRVDALLARVGLPAAPAYPDFLPPPYPPPSGYAAVTDIDKVPFLSDRGREFYRAWLSHPTPRVLAISPSGKMTATFEGFDPASTALRQCRGTDGSMCRLYAIDDDVVWRPLPLPPGPSGLAAVTDAAAIPYAGAQKTAFLAKFLTRSAPRALVVARTGGLYGSYGVHAWEQAWVNCTAVNAQCEPYIVDDAVVWRPGLYADIAGPQFHTTLHDPADKPFQIGADNSTIAVSGAPAHDADSARKAGDGLLTAPLIAAAFENAPQGIVAGVRHRASGIVCRDPKVIVYSPVANEPEFAPAAVATCVNRVARLQSELSVSRLPLTMDGRDALAAVVKRAEHEDKDVAPVEGPSGTRAALQSATTPLYIALALDRCGPWVVWVKVRADATRAKEAGQLADMLLKAAIADIQL